VVDQMKFGLYGLHRGVTGDPEALARRAGTAEDAGFEGLWVGDHVALPAGPGDAARLEAVVAVTFLAAVTSRIRLALGGYWCCRNGSRCCWPSNWPRLTCSLKDV
jgi:alkanesulfonate monooxygenase SsuD/methylene tetrahydromethanopterin reductase-like flavin-dependent oxidoreductase (luciferase family)